MALQARRSRAIPSISSPSSNLRRSNRRPDLFTVTDANLNGETRKAIAIAPTAGTRLTWNVTVPDDGWLWVSVALKPEAWEKDGDGVKFHGGVSDGRAYEQLFTQHVDPFNNPSDRSGSPVKVDLSAYAGEQVDADPEHERQQAEQGRQSAQRSRAVGFARDRRSMTSAHARRRAAARSRGAVSAVARRAARRDHPRLRQPAVHHGAGGRGARARARRSQLGVCRGGRPSPRGQTHCSRR